MKTVPTRKKIRLSRDSYAQGHAFFLTINTYMKYPWFRIYPYSADEAIQLLRHMASKRKSKLFAWSIMPDHIHLLLKDSHVVDFVQLFKGRMAPKALALERSRRLWQRSFYDHALRKDEALREVALYIWENPVRAGIVDRPTKYEWNGSEVWPNWKEDLGRG